MNPLSEIILLGDTRLHEACSEVKEEELPSLLPVIKKMHGLILEFRKVYGFGRAIAAPQIGVLKRMIVKNLPGDIAQVYFNPRITGFSKERMELWDNCMSFPNLYVKLERSKWIKMSYRDITWNLKEVTLDGDDSELLQHEIDHLDGILSIDRAGGSHDMKWVFN
ncbi:MAG: peptide deformylase [Bacteroidia bacterium]|nr:peptide deformylase [Bacteroidia bacterium]